MIGIFEGLPRPFFVLAPMDDVTDTVFRQVVASCASPDLFFTEFVNVDGLQSPGRPKLLPKLQFSSDEKPIIAQIWGKTPDNYYKTTKDVMAMGYDGVDINMGCPDKTIVKNGCCSAFINNRDLAKEVISATRAAAGDHFPVSVKTRVGFTTIDLTWIEFLLKQKLNMLTIHLRTKNDMSKVPARWELMTRIIEMRNELSPTTLIVGNGDIMTRQQGEQLAQKYQLDGVMIGRGIFADPYVFAKKSSWSTATKEQRLLLYKNHVELFAKTWANNERRVPTLNKFCKVYVQGFDGAKELREKLMGAKSTKELLQILSGNLSV